MLSNITNDVLLGYLLLKELNVISKKFPQASFSISSDVNFEQIKNAICDEFPDVICNFLPDQAMDRPPMKINLSHNVKPYKILIAHPIPRHYQNKANALISNLLEKGIIARVEGMTNWTAPAFLVPKNKRLDKSLKNNLWLVTDLSVLNKYIIRPVHPFPSANTILSNIPSNTQYFTSLDAIRMRKKVMAFNFEIIWLNRKNNVMADALSRNLICKPKSYEIKSYIFGNNKLINGIHYNAKESLSYKMISEALTANKDPQNLLNRHPAKPRDLDGKLCWNH